MYESYFGFTELPFSIAPNPAYLFMSSHHREAMAHLLFGVREGGGFVQLTGEVGTGKTTLCRRLLSELPDNVDVALILNPRINELELMQSVCDELRINYESSATVKNLLDHLNSYLLDAHAKGRNTVLIIDEAQNLSFDVLEQVRLLTNLETSQKKLLQIILVGQTELREMLSQKSLRQLSQRITARYHLKPLDRRDLREYLVFRLKQSGCERFLFTRSAVSSIYRLSNGIPRIINVLCDRALLGAYSTGNKQVNAKIVRVAGMEVMGSDNGVRNRSIGFSLLLILILASALYTLNASLLPSEIDSKIKRWVPEWMYTLPPSMNFQYSFLSIAKEAFAESPGLHIEYATEITRKLESASFKRDLVSLPEQLLTASALKSTLRNLGVEKVSRLNGLRELVSQWRLPTTIVFDCVTVSELGLKCFGLVDNLDDLKNINRPAMIQVNGDGESLGYIVVTFLVGDEAVIRFSDKSVRIKVSELTKLWGGETLVLWKPPALDRIPISENSSIEDVLWLRRALNFEQMNYGMGAISRIDRAMLDAELLNALNQFQIRSGLQVRSIVDVAELIQLNSRIGYHNYPILEAN